MQIGLVPPGHFVKCGNTIAQFLRLSGPDALVETLDGKRLTWSQATEVILFQVEEHEEEDRLPKLEARLRELENFATGKYAQLGIAVDTPCTELPKSLHPIFIQAALGEQPEDAIVCRRCTTKLCIRADHIFWGTRSDCQRDMCLRGVARPSGKKVNALQIATQIVRLRFKISRLKNS
jgi:hypothetical protein